MKAFAGLLDSLVFTPSRNGKVRLLGEYFATAPDPDRGWALAAITGELALPTAKPALVRGLVAERTDPVLFALSYDFVGDLAETAALIWPEGDGAAKSAPSLDEVVTRLRSAGRSEVPGLLTGWLDCLDPTERWALLKLITGALRVGVSARLARTALAERFDVELADVEEVWHGVDPPYAPLFAWLDGPHEKPDVESGPGFRPLMLSNPLSDADLAKLDLGAYRAEWKWDGIRVQLVARGGERRIYSRTGDDIGAAFPDVVAALDFDAVVDGELLVYRGDPEDGPPYHEISTFNDLQQRLNRKSVTAKLQETHPAFVRLYDILLDGDEDLRPLPFDSRRRRLEEWYARAPRRRLDLSPLLETDSVEQLKSLREGARAASIEGLMLKRGDSIYQAGRPKGPWFKWKRDPLTLDVVLLYAQRGHGRRSSYYSDFTFGAWRPTATADGEELVPVGKAYFGFTDEELLQLDRWVRNKTVRRYGPVREVRPELVLEVAFDSVHRSNRHKSGVAMRFPRVHRIRWDKPAFEADRLATLEALIEE